MNRKRLAQFNINNIIDGADGLFRKFGYETTTMNQIAKAAKYSKTTVYAYFPSKESIFFSIVLQHMLQLDEDFVEVVARDEDFTTMFYSLCNVLVEMQKQKPVYFEGMIGNINMQLENKETPLVFKEIFEKGNHINVTLYGLLDKGIKEGLLEENVNKNKLMLYLWGSITGIIRMTEEKADYFLLMNYTRDDLLKYCFDNVLNGIVKR